MSSFSMLVRAAAAGVLVLTLFVPTHYVRSEPPAEDVRAAVEDLNAWLNASDTGPDWHKYLETDRLEALLDKSDQADALAVAKIVRKYALGSPETDRPRFLRVRRALEGWLTELPPPPAEELAALAQKAKDVFIPRTKADLSEAKAGLDESVARLKARLNPADPQSDRWRAYLKWDELQQQLARPEGPELATLDAIYAKYAAGHEGLELIWFADVRIALRRYLTTARAVGDPKLDSQYRILLDALPEYLEAYRQNPTVEGAVALSTAIRWLEEAGQAPWLVAAIRRNYTRPNLFARIDADVVAAGIEGPVDEVEPVRDVILGTNVYGTGHTVGQVSVELIPCQTRAEVQSVFQGTVESETVGYNGPARIYSDGVTEISTRKLIVLDAEGFSTEPAVSEAGTTSKIKGVRAGRGRVIQRAATKRTYSQKYQAESISARHAEQRANCRADRQAAELIEDSQKSFVEKFRDPLQDRRLFPKQLDFSTTADAVHVTGLQVGPYDLGAPNGPPETISPSHLALQVHESMFNNLAQGAYGGAIVQEERFLEGLEQFLGSLPEQFQPDEDTEPWKITFARQQPISVTFGDGGFSLTMRGRRFVSGDNSYPDDMDITAVYKIVKSDNRFKAVRQGDLQIAPPGGKRLSARQVVLRDLLQRRFNKVFDAEIVPEPLELPGQWKESGEYGLAQWETADGWMVMAWNRLTENEAAAATSTP